MAELRCADRGGCTSTFTYILIFIHGRAVAENRPEREELRIAIQHDAAIDLGDTLQYSR